MRAPLGSLLLLLAVATGGCSEEVTSPADGLLGPDPCFLLDAEVVDDVLGEARQYPLGPVDGADTCELSADSVRARVAVPVIVNQALPDLGAATTSATIDQRPVTIASTGRACRVLSATEPHWLLVTVRGEGDACKIATELAADAMSELDVVDADQR